MGLRVSYLKRRRYLAIARIVGAVPLGAAVAALADGKPLAVVVTAAVSALISAFAPMMVGPAREWILERRPQLERSRDLPFSPSMMLHPAHRVVGFLGRGWEMEELAAWARDDQGARVRLVVAPAGVGKTRLAWQFVRRLEADRRWRILRPPPGEEDETITALLDVGGRTRVLVVVDYADARSAGALARLMCAVHDQPRSRVLLLARSAGDWWYGLSGAHPARDTLVDALTVRENVMTLSARLGDRSPAEIVEAAIDDFTRRLKVWPRSPVRVRYPDGGWPVFTPVLLLHAEALYFVLEDHQHITRQDVLLGVLRHEMRYWRHCARRTGVLRVRQHEWVDAIERLLPQVAGVASLLGATGDEEMLGLVRRVPALAGREYLTTRLVDWLRILYPETAEGPGRLGTLQPSMLAETLAVETLTKCSPGERGRILAGLSHRQAEQARRVLTRALRHRPDAQRFVQEVIAAHPRPLSGDGPA